jgi:predicted phosphodiesterase
MPEVNIDEALDALTAPVEAGEAKPPPPRNRAAEWRPGVFWEGNEGTLTTDIVAGADLPNWDHVLNLWGLNPEKFAVVEPVLFNVWGDPEKPFRQWKGKVVSRVDVAEGKDYADLIEEIKKHKPPKKAPPTGDSAFVVNLADWQIGRGDPGDGLKEVVARILSGIDAVEVRIKELRKMGRSLGELVVFGLGDIIEGCGDDFYAMGTFTSEADRRDQVKIARRLIRDALKRWSRLFNKVTVAAVGGNHGENRKDGKAYTTFNDNDDVAIFEHVAEIFAENPEAYGHVRFILPRHQLTLTLEVAGKIVGITHGHVAKASGSAEQKLRTWLANQSLGRLPIGDAEILVTGHYHHLRTVDWGSVHWLQTPALCESLWFTQTSGQWAQLGVLTFTITPDLGVRDIQVVL